MTTFDDSYVRILKRILDEGVRKHNRTGTDTVSVFCDNIVAEDAQGVDGFPISRLRKIHWRGAIIETLWMLGLHENDKWYAGLPITNVHYLRDNGVNYWDPWADENGNLGPVYGEQLVRWKCYRESGVKMSEEDNVPRVERINQVQGVIDKLRKNPDDRRLVCSMWNPSELDKMVLPPCHYAHEYYSRIGSDGRRYLDIRWIQRSCDMPLGIPYNVLQYTILDKIVALCTNHVPGIVYGCLGDCHVYVDQLDAVREIVRRYDNGEHLSCQMPKLAISDRLMDTMAKKDMEIDVSNICNDGSDFSVEKYESLPAIKIPVSV